jgi:hypothetical protein
MGHPDQGDTDDTKTKTKSKAPHLPTAADMGHHLLPKNVLPKNYYLKPFNRKTIT